MGRFDAIIGTLLVGICFNTFLYGLVVCQFVMYHRAKFNDQWITKCAVLFLFVLDTVHTTSVIYLAWDITVTNFGDLRALHMGLWPYEFTPIITGLSAFATQMCLGFRIRRLTKSNLLLGIVVLLAIPAFILAATCTAKAFMIRIQSELPRITPIVIAWLSMQVAVDVFISSTLIIVFSRSRTGFQKMDNVLNRLIRTAVQTGLFAGIFSMGDLITFILLPNTNLYGMFAIPIGRIYTNTLLDSLLARESLRAELFCPRCQLLYPANNLEPKGVASNSTQGTSEPTQESRIDSVMVIDRHDEHCHRIPDDLESSPASHGVAGRKTDDTPDVNVKHH